MRWLLSRGFRGGQRYADIVERPTGVRLLSWFAKRAGFLGIAALLTVSCLPFSKSLAMRYAIKVASNLGQLSSIFEYRYEEYRHRTG
jgi:hypothetical protein